jgi:phospholipid/cholesterol/gamma-HCH transport system permease protein
VGQITRALIHAFFHPVSVRWKDALLTAERSGVNALPIVTLISFIVGLVMAFQSAMPMKMFGAEIYVANLIGIAMVRELGPLMTAIILAGRSGSAFAAEIGTMKINEEIDALSTMGLDPVRFLMVPRIIAAVFITPLLTIFSNFVGIMGGSIVLLSMGYPAVTYYSQVVSFVTWIDFTGGLVKCFVFGILIAASGCIRGIETQSGPGAVGASTTSAVVTGITLIAVFDGIFSVLFYCLGI